MIENKEKVAELEKEKEDLLAYRVTTLQHSTSCTTKDLSQAMLELSLMYEEINKLKESLIEKQTKIDYLKYVVSSKETSIVEIEKAEKEAEVKYSKARSRSIGKAPLYVQQSIFYGINYQLTSPNS